MSRFNQLYLADAQSVIDELENESLEPTTDELRLALINALGMIVLLQKQIRDLRELVRQGDAP